MSLKDPIRSCNEYLFKRQGGFFILWQDNGIIFTVSMYFDSVGLSVLVLLPQYVEADLNKKSGSGLKAITA